MDQEAVHLTREDNVTQATRRSKYSAQPTTVNGIRFDSKAESIRYAELLLALRAKDIKALEIHPKYPLFAPGVDGTEIPIGAYEADFCYSTGSEHVVEDVKGMRTPLYRWKKKHFEAQYDQPITEIEVRNGRSHIALKKKRKARSKRA